MTELRSFTIASENQKFVHATANPGPSTIGVSSPDVKEPVAVRYACWADNPICNVYSRTGLPLTLPALTTGRA
ncbi:MAG: hypothetical protein U0794_00910 [Isosphaeraceae bacterium]